jgi:hypothetical protein
MRANAPTGAGWGGVVFRERKGRREALCVLGIVLFLGAGALARSADPKLDAALVRMTIEVDWNLPAERTPVVGAPAPIVPRIELELTEGRLLGVTDRSGGSGSPAAEPRANGSWMVGSTPTGRVRARIEAPISASVQVRAGGQVMQVPILGLLEGPQHTPTPMPVSVGIERVPWDALEVSLAGGDGTIAPGTTLPVNVGFNVLTPEPTEVALRLSAELRPIRGGEVLWRTEQHHVVATNAAAHPRIVLTLPAPAVEGTYVLDLRSTWEPVAAIETSRLGRWLRSRRRGLSQATSSSRRVTLAVVSPKAQPAPLVGQSEVMVDAVDLTRSRVHRPSAAGRAALVDPGRPAWPVPESALFEARRLDLLRSLITRSGSDAAMLSPADATGLGWSAFNLKVARPGRPHRLTLTVTGGHPSALGVGLLAPGGVGGRPRVLLDACASGLPILEGGPLGTFSWLVWPDAEEPLLVLLNRGSSPVRVGLIELTELASVPSPPALPETHPNAPRTLGLYLAGPRALDRFGGGSDAGLADAFGLARNLAGYASSCGASSLVLPDGLADRAGRSALDGQADEDATGPDRLDLALRMFERRGLSVWLSVDCDGPLHGLPAPGSPEALARGMVRVDHRGQADNPPAYHPLHARVQEALKNRLIEAIAARSTRPALAGLLVRLGPGPTLLGGPDTGFDDATFSRFVSATGLEAAGPVPGLGTEDPKRFAARARFLSGPGRMPWLTWRSREIGKLYGSLAKALAQAAPGSILAVATPGLDDSPAGQEARRGDLAGLPPHDAWRAVGLDLELWPTGDGSPLVLRGVGLSADDLAHDLASSPELDAQVASRHQRGFLLWDDADGDSSSSSRHDGLPPLCLTATAAADGPAGDEPLGHALAALDASWVVLDTRSVTGQEERIRRFATIFRSLPGSPDRGASPALARGPSGLSVRSFEANQKTYLALANDTPYPVRLETVLNAPASATVFDLGRGLALAPESVTGGKRLVLDLQPFGVAGIRVGAPGVRIAAVKPYHPATVLAGLEARKDDISRSLAQLNRMARDADNGPTNPGFEPNIELTGVHEAAAPNGWRASGDPATVVAIDPVQPRSGQGSLRLDASAPVGGGVTSDSFVPPAGTSLTVRAWLRSERPDTPVRFWLEGEQAGQPFEHQVDLFAQPFWSAVIVPVAGIPPGGLDHARLRFELPASGRLWLDDLSISGESLSEPERRNARRTLLAALQAYREQRYADFARLASSHWARQAEPGSRLATRETDRTSLRSDDSSALPANRRLR